MIEDREVAVNLFRKKFSEESVNHDFFNSGDPGLIGTITSSGADSVVLSLPLMNSDPLEIIADLRKKGMHGAIVVLQDHPNTEEAIALYNAGADDVSTKPIQPRHLVVRIRSILRRQNGYVKGSVQIGDLNYHFDGQPPEVNNEPISLSPRERSLLECLVLRNGRVVTRDFIFSNLYGNSAGQVDPKIIDVYICKLRKKIKDLTNGDYISTVFGTGYMFAAPEKEKVAAQEDVADVV